MSLLLAPLLWALAPPVAHANPAPPLLPPTTRVERLDNGLAVVVVPLETQGLVSVQTWMDVGARDELAPGTTGYAHFFEHLMFEGSRALPREPRQQRLLALAVDENAWTSEDFTVYHSLAPARSLGELLDLEGDRFARLHLDEAAVRRESGAVQGEWRKSQADPDNAAWNALLDAAFRVHPYRHPVIGFDADVAAMPDGTPRVVAFLRDHYRPERATLVVAGDVDPDDVLRMVRESHGGWRRPGEGAARVLPAEPPQVAPRRVHVPWTMGDANPRVVVAWKVPAFAPGDRDSATLQLTAELLGARVSPLYRRLVDEEGLVRDLWVPTPDSRSPGLLMAWATLAPGADPVRVEEIIREEALALTAAGADGEGPVAPEVRERVALARERARRLLLLSLDSPAAWGAAIGRAATVTGDPRALEAHAAALGAVRPIDVRRGAEAWLTDARSTVVVLGAPDLLAALPPPLPLPPPDALAPAGEVSR